MFLKCSKKRTVNQPRMLYPMKIPCRKESEIKTLSDEGIRIESVASRPALKELFREVEVLQNEMK